ncbi:hypothetical protein JXJ21_07790 [candidate division KSB1 bacterium]|nr:hypothetical protein [candidate division KSB1 bacterium]
MKSNTRINWSERIQTLREQVMVRKGSVVTDPNPYEMDVALWRAAKPGRSRVQQRAAYLHELVELAKIEIQPDWAFAGEHLPTATLYNNFGFTRKLDSNEQQRIHEFGLSDGEIEAVKQEVNRWLNRDAYLAPDPQYYAIGEGVPDNYRGKGGWGDTSKNFVYWGSGWIENHSIRDYAKVLRIGFSGIKEEIEKKLAHADISSPDYLQCENFWRAGLRICDAGIALGRRYAALAEKTARASNRASEKSRLKKMAQTCHRIPAEGARTFYEAVQSLWLAHILTCGEDGINANSIGRLDQILYPYYRRDFDAGRLTRQQALEMMAELACKLYLEYDVQAIVLGGVDERGDDAVNELSYIILEATRHVGFIRDVSVRLHRNSSEKFIHQCAESIAAGGGIPFIFNDDCFIGALVERGIALDDARNYAPIGCIELTIPGKANPHAVSGWINSVKCLELALFDGMDPATGEQTGPHTGKFAEMATFEDLLRAYHSQLEFFTRRMVYHCNRGELAQRERGPLPCWSVLTDACIDRGRDITDGGALYHYHSICFMGTANTADSLMAIKKLVFQEQAICPSMLIKILKANFQGYEHWRQMLLKRAPKYGNNEPEVDALAAQIDEHFIELMDRFQSPLGGRYFVHLFSFLCNLAFGKVTGATPDGRFAGEPIAYSLSAQQGRDEKGVTALLNSLSKLPHSKAAGATAAIIELDPKLVAGEPGVQRLVQLIRSAINMNIGQLQFNVVTAERLLRAQKCPEKYGNIPVRVAGFSQMFKLIDQDLQNHIIARTKHET